MRGRNRGRPERDEPRGRHLKEVHAPEGPLLPGKIAVPKPQWWADPQALRKAAEGAIFVVFVLVFGTFGFRLYYGTSEAARRTGCRTNLRMVGLALTMYAADHEGMLPPADGNLARQVLPYLPEVRFLLCPSDDQAAPYRREPVVQPIISYSYVPPQFLRLDWVPAPVGTPLAWDRNGGVPPGAHRDGGNILFADGHTGWRPAERWRAADYP